MLELSKPHQGVAFVSATTATDALFPVFLKLRDRRVLLVGAGPVAASKLRSLLDAGASVTVVAPEVHPEILRSGASIVRRGFEDSDLDGVFLAVAAATPEVNRQVRAAGDARQLFVNAVDEPETASAYTGGVLRRGGVTIAVSTEGQAPALAGLLREALEDLVPEEIEAWVAEARALRTRQRATGVPMAQRRPQLLEALNRIYERTASATAREARGVGPGSVALVGAGPGDPDLLTLRGARRLAEADIVFYDALVDVRVLDLAPRAKRFSVGKRAGRTSIRQETINALMIRAARRGLRVVRLKCGDPFVLGRGGEEALALLAASVPFEVVPGLSSALAAPALLGIPVTHRGLASSFTVVSGHAEDAWRPVLSALSPGLVTVVILMGLGARREIAKLLINRGWREATPVAIALGASTEAARSWTGDLAQLALVNDAADEATAPFETGGLPGVIVIGEVVGMAETLGSKESDFEGLPLAAHG